MENRSRKAIAYKRSCAFLRAILLLAIIGAFVPAHASPKILATTELQIDSHRHDVFWLDNDTIVFVGANTSVDRDASGLPPVQFPQERGHLYLWRLSSEPQLYRPDIWPEPGSFASRNYVCAAEGKIYYSIKAPTKTPSPPGLTGQVMAGIPGKEEPQSFRLEAVDPQWSHASSLNFSGKRCDQLYAPWMERNFWIPSFDRKKILDLGLRTPPALWKPLPIGESGKAVRIVDVSTRDTTVIRDVDAHWIRYACVNTPSWQATFVVWKCLAGEDAEAVRTFPVWKIFSDGRSERTDIETGEFNDPDLIPFKNGYYLQVRGLKGVGSNEATDGLYKVRDGKPVMILKGWFRAHAVSPDGCKGAFSEATRHEYGDARERLIVLDLCQSGGPKN